MGKVTVKPSKLVQALLLLLFTAFLCRLVSTRGIYMLVSPLIATIVTGSIFVFAILTVVSLVSSVSVPMKTVRSAHIIRVDAQGQERVGNHHHDHDHHHVSLNSTWGRTTAALLLASLCLAFAWHPRALGTDMIAQADTASGAAVTSSSSASGVTNWVQNTPGLSAASVSAADSSYYATEGAVQQKTGQMSAAEIAVDWEQTKSKYLGHNVSLEGFVYHPVGLPANYFIITRYFIFCCIADASAMGVAVQSPAAGTLKNDQWVSVSGVMQNQDLPKLLNQYDPTSWYPNQHLQPVITANSITRIPVPKLPYMVPNY